MRTLFFLLAIILVSGSSLAQESPLFGFEWTFTNQYLLAHHKGLLTPLPYMNQDRERDHWIEIVQEACRGCEIDLESKTIHLPSNKWFKIKSDGGVLEVNAAAMTLEELRAHQDIFQKLIWDAAKQAGLLPHARLGGGHIHIDNGRAFDGDKWLYRNFIVDFMNHSPAFLGGFGQNFLNAPPLSVFGKESILSMRRILKSFDHGDLSLNQLRNLIIEEVYGKTPDIGTFERASHRYHALNLGNHYTTEIRALRPQLSMRHSVLLAQIIESRIEHLKTLKKPIPLKVSSNRDLRQVIKEYPFSFYQSTIPPEQIEDSVRSYIKPSGISFHDIAPFMTEEFKERKKESGPRCRRLFY